MRTVQDLFLEGKSFLKNLPNASLEARLLVTACLGISDESFYASPERRVTESQESEFWELAARRMQGVPLAYLTGEKEFWSLRFAVGPGVLIPRPETELLVEKVIELSSRRRELIAEIGTGAGHVAVALAKELPQAAIVATDVSPRALEAAERNARLHKASRIEFAAGPFYAPLKKRGLQRKCDFIVSNPPYVSAHEWGELPDEIKNHEPREALVAGESGLESIRELIRQAPKFLKPGGYLCLEIGWDQEEKVFSFFGEAWERSLFFRDLNGISRVVVGRTRRASA